MGINTCPVFLNNGASFESPTLLLTHSHCLSALAELVLQLRNLLLFGLDFRILFIQGFLIGNRLLLKEPHDLLLSGVEILHYKNE
jgi:hypothetical protein